jgi:hypothetical protein
LGLSNQQRTEVGVILNGSHNKVKALHEATRTEHDHMRSEQKVINNSAKAQLAGIFSVKPMQK